MRRPWGYSSLEMIGRNHYRQTLLILLCLQGLRGLKFLLYKFLSTEGIRWKETSRWSDVFESV